MSQEIFAPIIDSQMTISDALKQVFTISNANKTTAMGFNQASKAILSGKSIFVLIAKDYEESRSAIIKNFCRTNSVPVIEIENRQDLASIVGFVKVSANGVETPATCGVASLQDFVYETDGRYFVENYIRDISAH